MSQKANRRAFIKNSLLTPAAVALTMGAGGRDASAQNVEAAPEPAAAIPCGQIGDLRVSRLLLGGNLLTHYTHSRDLKYVYNLTAHYNTEEKIIETLALAEQHGINTLVVHTVPRVLNILKQHRLRNGGKIQWIICPTAPVDEDCKAYTQQVQELVDDGTEAIYLWGVTADALVSEGKGHLIAKAVAVAKEQGVPSGVGAHDLKVIETCESMGVDADFYIKTFHHHKYPSAPKPDEVKKPYDENPGYWCANPEAVINVMKNVTKPWIAFKVMSAGAIPPQDAFQYVFDNGADHILAGMFDFEIAEDAALVAKTLPGVNRQRPWRS